MYVCYCTLTCRLLKSEINNVEPQLAQKISASVNVDSINAAQSLWRYKARLQ
jgi:hypothetical protein